jgi:hypothetical protein
VNPIVIRAAGCVLSALALLFVGTHAVPDASAAAKRSAGAVFVNSTTFTMSGADQKRRSTVGCRGGKRVVPLGGGMVSNPSPGSSGEGVYPHSYERLGAQGGWHVTPVFYDPTGSAAPRTVTLQVICGPKSTSVVPVHRTVYVQPGEDRAASVRCPGKRRLFAGGFQRTNFVTRGGNYVTSSRATSQKTWTVTGSAFGGFGGEMTALIYCRASGKPLVTEVSATTNVASGDYGAAATPACPGGRVLVSGGFSTFPSTSSLFADGYINADGGWTAGIYNKFGPSTTVTAYGYCHSPKFHKARKGESDRFRSVKAPRILQRAEKAAISERVLNKGCYPGPAKLARAIHHRTHLRTGTAHTQGSVKHANRVYVLVHGASCDLSRLSARVGGGVFTINSATGTVKVKH